MHWQQQSTVGKIGILVLIMFVMLFDFIWGRILDEKIYGRAI